MKVHKEMRIDYCKKKCDEEFSCKFWQAKWSTNQNAYDDHGHIGTEFEFKCYHFSNDYNPSELRSCRNCVSSLSEGGKLFTF